jgi:hypothetical protein
MTSQPFDPELINYASTDLQKERLQKWLELGSQSKAATECGCDKKALHRAIRAAEKNAARKGYAPGQWETGVAPGFYIKNATQHFKRNSETGEMELVETWPRQHPDAEALQEFVKEVKASLLEDVKPYQAEPFTQDGLEDDIIPWFQIGDAHLGAVAYMRETGHNFDLDIGAAELREAFRSLLDKCHPGKRCVINDLGDATHYENFKAETERGGHRLDADTRFPKMIHVYTRVMREIIELALTKFETVDVIVNQGNHSRTNDIWMQEYTSLFSELIEARYGSTGRVNSISNESVFVGYRMGKTFVMTHHSDKCSGEKLADVMFRDFIDDVKHCEFFYIDTGHVHHSFIKKERGIVQIESWNNLAPNDKHHHDAGYRSKQCMTVVFRSRTYGYEGQHTIPVQKIWERLSRVGGVKTSRPVANRAFVA